MRRRPCALVPALALAALAACVDGPVATETPTPPATSAPGAPAATAGSLAEVCPNPVVVQTDGLPAPEHAGLYRLVGPNGRTDEDAGTHTGPLLDTGVDLEIRFGGPYLGGRTASAEMYADEDVLLGHVGTDEAVELSKSRPTVAVVAPLEGGPPASAGEAATYPSPLAVRREALREEADCLERLVPIVQRAQVDYVAEPAPVDDALAGVVEALAGAATPAPGGDGNAAKAMLDRGLVSNGPDRTLGNFDLARVERLVAAAVAAFESLRVDTVDPDVRATDVVTTEFVDPGVGLPVR